MSHSCGTEGSLARWKGKPVTIPAGLTPEVLAALVDGVRTPEDLEEVFRGLKKAITERVPRAELTHQLGYAAESARCAVEGAGSLAGAQLRAIYQAPSEAAGRTALEAFAASPAGQRYPQIAALWARHWKRIAPALLLPLPVRRLWYSTNSLESLRMILRKTLKLCGHFPTTRRRASCSISRSGTPARGCNGRASGGRPCSTSRSSSGTASRRWSDHQAHIQTSLARPHHSPAFSFSSADDSALRSARRCGTSPPSSNCSRRLPTRSPKSQKCGGGSLTYSGPFLPAAGAGMT